MLWRAFGTAKVFYRKQTEEIRANPRGVRIGARPGVVGVAEGVGRKGKETEDRRPNQAGVGVGDEAIAVGVATLADVANPVAVGVRLIDIDDQWAVVIAIGGGAGGAWVIAGDAVTIAVGQDVVAIGIRYRDHPGETIAGFVVGVI